MKVNKISGEIIDGNSSKGANFLNKNSAKITPETQISIQPNMLPPLFRSRVRFLQKLYMIFIIVSISFAIGAISFVLLNNFTIKYGLIDDQVTFFVISLVLVLLVFLVSLGYVYWCRSRAYFTSWNEMLNYLIPSAILGIGFILLDYFAPSSATLATNQATEANNLFRNIGLIGVGIAGWTTLQVVVTSIVKTRTYPNLKIRVFWTFLGQGLLCLPALLIWLFGEKRNMLGFETIEYFYIFGSFVLGILLLILGSAVTARYRVSGQKNRWVSIKSFGSLPSLVITTILIVIGFRFIVGIEEGYMPLVIAAIVCAFVILIFFIFLAYKAFIKNIPFTNPLFNEFIVKSTIVGINFAMLLIVAFLPNMVNVRTYQNLSFGIMGIGALASSIVIVAAYFSNLITFSKFFKSVLIVTITLILVSFIVISVLSTINSSSLVISVASRWIAIFLLVVSIVCEIALASINVAYVYKDIFVEWRVNRKVNKEEVIQSANSGHFSEKEEVIN